MNPNDPRHSWSRLTAAARQRPEEADATAPHGFSTRVAALAFAGERRSVSLYERFALRAVGVAGLMAVASIAANFSVFSVEANATELVMEDYDPVAMLMDEGQ
jgi:hypothetical protein